MAIRRRLCFLLNDGPVSLDEVPTDRTLLDFLRLECRLTGTKEGCAEGDCGACTVLVGRLHAGQLDYAPVNACIRPLASLDGCHVVTIEHLGGRGGDHPLQTAMVDCHGSQCGFCTPGIVMALEADRLTGGRDPVAALQGNLCRCTGYGAILQAARQAATAPHETTPLLRDKAATTAQLAALADDADLELSGPQGGISCLPANRDTFAEIVATRPDARIVAGATDFALDLTKRLHVPKALIFTGRVTGFDRIDVDDGTIRIGPNVTFAQAMPVLDQVFPQLSTLWSRIGGPQVRHSGTIVGNIANGSPIGDGPPVWIALGAELVLRRGQSRRRLAIEDYFIDYGRQDRQPGEFIEEISVPLSEPDTIIAAHKVSKRFDEDISAVMGAFAIRLEGGIVAAARIAFGGMAGVPKRAHRVEAALIGQPWTATTVDVAGRAFPQDFSPLSDMRASAGYRLSVAQSLLTRVWLGNEGVETDLMRLSHV